MLGDVLGDLVEFVFADGWIELTKATHERFGWAAATAVALSPVVILAFGIWLLVLWVG